MLNKQDLETVDTRAELIVRRYFDHYLEEIFPKQMEAHDQNCGAHGGVAKKVSKLVWIIAGTALGSGGLGALLSRLVGS